jgi:ribosomal protein S18 acetylase RimI-like enzyme
VLKEVKRLSSVIEAGWIKKNKGSTLQEDVLYEMRFIDDAYLKDMMALEEIIIQNLSDKEIFRTHSPDYFIDHFKVENSVIGVFADDGLIAYNVLYFPGANEDNFGTDIGLPSDELNKVVHLETVAVHPAFRGNSLQRKMESVHLRTIQEKGYEHVCCMVSPKNHPSLRNILSHGLVIKALKIKFGWRLRYIMHKNLLHPSAIGPEVIQINGSSIEEQIDLMKKGFLGFQMIKLADGIEISYGKDCSVTT